MICNAFDSLTEFEKGVLKLQPLLKLIGFASICHLSDGSWYKLCDYFLNIQTATIIHQQQKANTNLIQTKCQACTVLQNGIFGLLMFGGEILFRNIGFLNGPIVRYGNFFIPRVEKSSKISPRAKNLVLPRAVGPREARFFSQGLIFEDFLTRGMKKFSYLTTTAHLEIVFL